ncbi:MAG: hypothetical protein MOB07_17970 [Acidobacteria bacterium]|nr:hypothetical protein [Acidobacteriota bacterium]
MNTTTTRPLAETASMIGDLIEQGARLYFDLLSSLSNSGLVATIDQMQDQMQRQMRQMAPSQLMRQMQRMTPRMGTGAGCGCDIPPPCWAPQPIGEVVSHACPGATATIRLRVTNCGAARRVITIEAAGQTPGVKIDPPTLALGPMERGVVSVSVSLPADAAQCQDQEVLLWVRGCQQHFLRWTVRVSSRGASCCHEVDVEDCPDLIHHWYDHFYCERPCPPRRDEG